MTTATQTKALAHYAPMALEASRPTWDTLPTIIRDLPDAWTNDQMQLVISALVCRFANMGIDFDGLLDAHATLEDNRSESEIAADREAEIADRKRWEQKERDL